jgi:hypothetical protein
MIVQVSFWVSLHLNITKKNSSTTLQIIIQIPIGGMSPPPKRGLELEIKTLQNAPSDARNLRWLLQKKQRQKDEAMQ